MVLLTISTYIENKDLNFFEFGPKPAETEGHFSFFFRSLTPSPNAQNKLFFGKLA
jgi:hypothetical protein